MTSDKKRERVVFRLVTSHLSLVTVLITCHFSLVTVFAFAQGSTTGRIEGIVRDSNGVVIVGAEVTVTSLATSDERKVTTDTEGYYAVPALSPGTYRVRVGANGFNPALFEPVRVVITETWTLNAPLAVAGVIAQSVVVSARMEPPPRAQPEQTSATLAATSCVGHDRRT